MSKVRLSHISAGFVWNAWTIYLSVAVVAQSEVKKTFIVCVAWYGVYVQGSDTVANDA